MTDEEDGRVLMNLELVDYFLCFDVPDSDLRVNTCSNYVLVFNDLDLVNHCMLPKEQFQY